MVDGGFWSEAIKFLSGNRAKPKKPKLPVPVVNKTPYTYKKNEVEDKSVHIVTEKDSLKGLSEGSKRERDAMRER